MPVPTTETLQLKDAVHNLLDQARGIRDTAATHAGFLDRPYDAEVAVRLYQKLGETSKRFGILRGLNGITQRVSNEIGVPAGPLASDLIALVAAIDAASAEVEKLVQSVGYFGTPPLQNGGRRLSVTLCWHGKPINPIAPPPIISKLSITPS